MQIVVHRSLLQQIWRCLTRRRKKQRRRSAVSDAPTQQPPCPLCQAVEGQPSEPLSPPPVIEQKRGQPREVDTSHRYCPNEECRYYGWVGRGNIRANGHPNGGRWRSRRGPTYVASGALRKSWMAIEIAPLRALRAGRPPMWSRESSTQVDDRRVRAP